MTANGQGNVYVDPATDMAAHDACPASLRHFVNYAVPKYSSLHLVQAISTDMRDHQLSYEAAYRQHAKLQVVLTRQMTLNTYGPRHPEAFS